MNYLEKILNVRNKTCKSIWFMRQAGRYLPEFRKIRKKNKDFIKLCLNYKMVPEITLQPLKRFDLDAAIVFSDILMIPYGLGQKVTFSKGFGPRLEKFKLDKIKKTKSEDFMSNLKPIYKSLKKISKNKILRDKDLIGFVGAPWTLLVYMINQQSPKKKLKGSFFKDKHEFKEIFKVIESFSKIHILNQIKNGATIIQIFDSWAGLVEKKDLHEFVYIPNKNIVDYVKSLGVPAICFPKGIRDFKTFVDQVEPDVLSIDYEVKPREILKNISIPIQGGFNPNVLLTNKDEIKKEALKYINIFKDHPYIFNLGHGVLPQTNPNMVEYLVNFVKDN